MSHLRTLHLAHLNGSCHTHECIMPRMWMRHGKYMSEAHHSLFSKFQNFSSTMRVAPPLMWMSHVTRIHESCHTDACVMSHKQITPCFGKPWDWQPQSFYDHWESLHSFIRLTRLIHMSDIPNAYVWHDSSLLQLNVRLATTDVDESCDTHVDESCHTYERDMSDICVRHVTYMNAPEVGKSEVSAGTESWRHTRGRVMSHVCMCYARHIHESRPRINTPCSCHP